MSESDNNTIILNSINYKVIALIIALTIVDVIYGLYFFDGTHFDIKDGFFLAGIAGCAISSFIVAKKYWGSVMFTKAYLFLGLGFSGWFIGDIGYYYYEFVLDIDGWPSLFDAGFLASYIFAILHLSLNIRYFKPKWTKSMKSVIVVIPIIAVISFTFIAYNTWGEYDELVFEISYSNLMVFGISLTLAFAIIGASVFRHSVLKETWLLLVVGIFLWTVADSIYFYLETVELYTNNHPINALWSASFMIIIYALYKHLKVV